MGKLLNIAWKDLLVAFRDPPTLLLMLATPFALTLVMAFAFGGFGSSGATGMSAVPVALVNLDKGELGQVIVQTFQSKDLASVVTPRIVGSPDEARAAVDRGDVSAAVIIPSDLSTTIALPAASGSKQSTIEIYKNPALQLGPAVVQGVTDQVISRLSAASAATNVSIRQLIARDPANAQKVISQANEIASRVSQEVSRANLVAVRTESATGEQTQGINLIEYIAPSMPILFLMFTVMAGGRTILNEREWGTLPRLLTTPSTTAQVLGGKLLGVFLVGLAQMGILMLANWLIFGLHWSSASGVVLLTIAVVAGATGWGILVAAYTRTAAQAAQIGTVIALIFAILAGNFVSRQSLPDWMRTVGLITPNAWGLDGFSSLASGGTLADVLVPVIALFAMGAILFTIALFAFRRQYAS